MNESQMQLINDLVNTVQNQQRQLETIMGILDTHAKTFEAIRANFEMQNALNTMYGGLPK